MGTHGTPCSRPFFVGFFVASVVQEALYSHSEWRCALWGVREDHARTPGARSARERPVTARREEKVESVIIIFLWRPPLRRGSSAWRCTFCLA